MRGKRVKTNPNMGLLIIKGRDGRFRTTWYGRISLKGKRKDTNLNIPIEGNIPLSSSGNPNLTAKGDAAFERSRAAALKVFERWRAECQKDPAELQRKAYIARTGDSLEGVPLHKLEEMWLKQKRTYTPTENWQKAVKTWFKRFCRFASHYAETHKVKCETINDITPELVRAWFDDIKSEFTWETVSKQMSLMRSAYRRYATAGRVNPFEDIVMRNRETGNRRVNHKPLSSEELERLFAAAEGDDLLCPLIVCAACTGMRIGDVCLLTQESVDLTNGLIDVITAKAGVPATIPILPRLLPVLTRLCTPSGSGAPLSPYVFPEAAELYKSSPDAIYKKVKLYFAEAVSSDTAAKAQPVDKNGNPMPVEEILANAPIPSKRKERILKVYSLFSAGTKSCEIAESLGCAKSQVSMDLREVELLTGMTLRPRALATRRRACQQDLLDKTRKSRAIGQRQASIYGWHSLRATFVVLAHEAGVPLADIQRIVGHTTTEMTLQYFNPTKIHTADRVRRQMQGSVLGTPSRTDTAVEDIVALLSPEQRKKLALKLLGL